MEYLITYILLLYMIFFSFLLPRSKVWRILIIFIIFTMFAWSLDLYDHIVYENQYNLIGAGGESNYEIGFVFLCKLGNYFGLSFYQFRTVLVILELLLMYFLINKNTAYGTMVWALYLIFSSMFDAITMRHFIASIPMLFAFPLLNKKGIGNTIKYIVLVIIAGLCHSSFWFFLIFAPVSMLSNKKKFVISVITLILVYASTASGLIFKIYSLLPIREATVLKYNTGSMANLNGILMDCFMQFIYMLPAIIIWYKENRGAVVEYDNENVNGLIYLRKNLAHEMISFNVLFCMLIPFQVYAVNFSRLQRLLVLWNYIYLGKYMEINMEDNTKIKIGAYAYAALVLILAMVTSPSNWINVWFVHFGTNPIFEFFSFK